MALIRAAGRRLALVVDEDDRSLRVIDLDERREVSRTEVAGRPMSVLPLRDGRVVVSSAEPARLVVLEPSDRALAGFEERCVVDGGAEPVALAATPDESVIAVIDRWESRLTLLDGVTLRERSRASIGRDPISVIATADGATMIVAHATGSQVTAVAVETGAATRRSLTTRDERQVAVLPAGPGMTSNLPIVSRTIHVQSFALVRTARSILAPGVSIDTGNGIRSISSGYGEDIPVMGTVTALDPTTGARLHSQRRIPLGKRDCLMPRAAALIGTRLHVACIGLDTVVALDATKQDPRVAEDEPARRRVGAGPTGLAVWNDTGELVVLAALDREVSIESPGPRHPRVVIPLGPPRTPPDEDVALGRRIFLGEARKRLADDGRACASCHLDGRDDGLTWTTPDGQRQTPLLIDRLDHSAPFGWNGAMSTLDTHLRQTVGRLSGTGLDERERRAVIAYVSTLRAPVTTKPSHDVARGAELFASEAVGCASCHPGGGTDNLGHDVGGRVRGDRVFAIDTPSLRHLVRSAPYFHDGRYPTIDDVLTHTDGAMGHTASLSVEDRGALVAYLRSL